LAECLNSKIVSKVFFISKDFIPKTLGKDSKVLRKTSELKKNLVKPVYFQGF
jgi:hypothetical protein